MKRGLIAVAAAVLLLTGCSAAVQENVAVGSATGSPDASAESAAPLTAETPSAAVSAAPDETAFVEEVRSTLREENVIPNATDAQLVAAGQEACQLRDAGTAPEDISVIDGEERGKSGYFLDSFKIYSAAAKDLC